MWSPVVVSTGHQRVQNVYGEDFNTFLNESESFKPSINIFKGLTDNKNNNFIVYKNCNKCSRPPKLDEVDIENNICIETIHSKILH